jgi:putative tricarboxylic transport membrane protein
MRSRTIAEGTFAAVALAAGATLYILAPHYVRGWAFNVPGTTDVALEPSFFPRLAAILMCLAAAIVIATIPQRKGPLPLTEIGWHSYANVAAGLIGIFAYLMLITVIGFVTASALFIIVATWASGYRRVVVTIVTAIAVAFALRLVFRFGLHVNLPTGLLL